MAVSHALYCIPKHQLTEMKKLFQLEKKPRKGLLPVEWVAMGYLLFTLIVMCFVCPSLENPVEMLKGRLMIFGVTLAAWGFYRLLPCRLTRLVRILVQMALLSWWYPDTYELNRVLPNLDHIFAQWEQSWFGCQPSIIFSQTFSHPIFSELMDMGYFIYYPLIAAVAIYYFFWRYKDFGMASFVILTSFFAYYVIYVLLPVTGPQYYFPAIGLDNATAGIFPEVGNYFATLREAIESPGYKDGIFYQLVLDAHNAGERPTAAFPSSHVGVTTILMLLAWRSRCRPLFWCMLPFYVLLCLSTVYIMAHYAVDVLGGWLSAVIFYFCLKFIYNKWIKD